MGGIMNMGQLADHRLIVLLGALVESQARPKSIRHQLRYARRLEKWNKVPPIYRARAISRHGIEPILEIKDLLERS